MQPRKGGGGREGWNESVDGVLPLEDARRTARTSFGTTSDGFWISLDGCWISLDGFWKADEQLLTDAGILLKALGRVLAKGGAVGLPPYLVEGGLIPQLSLALRGSYFAQMNS